MSTFKNTAIVVTLALSLAVSAIANASETVTVQVPNSTKNVVIKIADKPEKTSRKSVKTAAKKKSDWPKFTCLESGETIAGNLGISWQQGDTIAKNLGFSSGRYVHPGCYVVYEDLSAKKIAR